MFFYFIAYFKKLLHFITIANNRFLKTEELKEITLLSLLYSGNSWEIQEGLGLFKGKQELFRVSTALYADLLSVLLSSGIVM